YAHPAGSRGRPGARLAGAGDAFRSRAGENWYGQPPTHWRSRAACAAPTWRRPAAHHPEGGKPVAAGHQRFPIISDGLPTQLPDIDADETREWVDSFDSV